MPAQLLESMCNVCFVHKEFTKLHHEHKLIGLIFDHLCPQFEKKTIKIRQIKIEDIIIFHLK